MKKNILTTEQASFLKQYNFSLYQERFEVLCEAQKAEKDGHLNFASDDEYKTFIDAVMTGEWSEELFMINLSNPIGCEHFLAAREDGIGGLIWDVVETASLKNKSRRLFQRHIDIVPLWSLRLLQKKTGVQKLNTNDLNKPKSKPKNMKSLSRTFQNLV